MTDLLTIGLAVEAMLGDEAGQKARYILIAFRPDGNQGFTTQTASNVAKDQIRDTLVKVLEKDPMFR